MDLLILEVHMQNVTFSSHAEDRCKGRIRLENALWTRVKEHSHLVRPQQAVLKQTLSCIRARAVASNDDPRTIIQETQITLSEETKALLPKYSSLERTIRRSRKRGIPCSTHRKQHQVGSHKDDLTAVELDKKDTCYTPDPASVVNHRFSAPTCSDEVFKPLVASSSSAVENDVLSRIKECFSALQREDEFDAIGRNVASQLRKMAPNMQIVAEKIINEVLYEGLIGILKPSTVLTSPDQNQCRRHAQTLDWQGMSGSTQRLDVQFPLNKIK
ncbi:hypothetical protein FHG87_005959 [Trinorchestia longiramus]|nr:hypothetical protein FHG87_005959 [Trinorchestia longiramus]